MKDAQELMRVSEGDSKARPEGGAESVSRMIPNSDIGVPIGEGDEELRVDSMIKDGIGEIFGMDTTINEWYKFDNIMAYKAVADPDVMYMHQEMRQPDKDKFKKAKDKEVKDQMGNGNFSIVRKDTVPKGKTILIQFINKK